MLLPIFVMEHDSTTAFSVLWIIVLNNESNVPRQYQTYHVQGARPRSQPKTSVTGITLARSFLDENGMK